MKKITFKTFEVLNPTRCHICGAAGGPQGQMIFLDPEGKQKCHYKELIISALDNPPQQGFLPSVMEERNRVVKKLKSAKGTVKLEDADFTVLHNAVKALPFRVRDEGFTEYWNHLDWVEETEFDDDGNVVEEEDKKKKKK